MFNRAYHNNGDGTFTDVSAETGIAGHIGKGMGVAVADYDGDGWMDIFVGNDNFDRAVAQEPQRSDGLVVASRHATFDWFRRSSAAPA